MTNSDAGEFKSSDSRDRVSDPYVAVTMVGFFSRAKPQAIDLRRLFYPAPRLFDENVAKGGG